VTLAGGTPDAPQGAADPATAGRRERRNRAADAARTSKETIVSNHAVLRWLERELRLDLSDARALAGPGAHDAEVLLAAQALGLVEIARERQLIEKRARVAIALGARAFHYGGLRFVIERGVVVTAMKRLNPYPRVSRDIDGRARQRRSNVREYA